MSKCLCPECVPDAQKLAIFNELVGMLEECADYMDDHSDVNDGDDGQPVANRAMSLLREIDDLLTRVKR
jgi:hypothetical protein